MIHQPQTVVFRPSPDRHLDGGKPYDTIPHGLIIDFTVYDTVRREMTILKAISDIDQTIVCLTDIRWDEHLTTTFRLDIVAVLLTFETVTGERVDV